MPTELDQYLHIDISKKMINHQAKNRRFQKKIKKKKKCPGDVSLERSDIIV